MNINIIRQQYIQNLAYHRTTKYKGWRGIDYRTFCRRFSAWSSTMPRLSQSLWLFSKAAVLVRLSRASVTSDSTSIAIWRNRRGQPTVLLVRFSLLAWLVGGGIDFYFCSSRSVPCWASVTAKLAAGPLRRTSQTISAGLQSPRRRKHSPSYCSGYLTREASCLRFIRSDFEPTANVYVYCNAAVGATHGKRKRNRRGRAPSSHEVRQAQEGKRGGFLSLSQSLHPGESLETRYKDRL